MIRAGDAALVRRLVTNRRLARRRGSLLGRWWALLLPLVESGVFTLVVGVLLIREGSALDYLVFVFPALYAWRVFARGVTAAGSSLQGRKPLLLSAPVPAGVPLLGTVGGVYLDAALALPVVVVLVLAVGGLPPAASLPWLLPAAAFHLVATVGLGALAAVAGAFYADARRALGPALGAAMFLTPVVYPADLVPEALRTLFLSNPVAAAIECLRAGLAGAPPPPGAALAGAAAAALALLAAGWWALRAADPRLREVL